MSILINKPIADIPEAFQDGCKTKTKQSGTLYVVATPIGHRQDITLRAVEILNAVDLIAAEDTRHSTRLLRLHGIRTPLKALHTFNEHQQLNFFIQQLQQGLNIALISDAGTPLIQDPGYPLIQRAIAEGITLSPIPGPCAAIAALCVAGAATHRFTFIGFLPTQKKARAAELQQLSEHPYTLIFYEAPHRVLQFLEEVHVHFGEDRLLSVARELTKIHESVYYGTANQLLQHFLQHPQQQQGEFVIVVRGMEHVHVHDRGEHADQFHEKMDVILKPLLKTRSLSEAVKITAEITALHKNAIYERALQLKAGPLFQREG